MATNYPLKSVGKVMYPFFLIFGPQSYFGTEELGHFKFGVHIDINGYHNRLPEGAVFRVT